MHCVESQAGRKGGGGGRENWDSGRTGIWCSHHNQNDRFVHYDDIHACIPCFLPPFLSLSLLYVTSSLLALPSFYTISTSFLRFSSIHLSISLSLTPLSLLPPECPPLLFTTQSSLSYGVQFGGSPPVFCHNGTPKATDVFHIRTLAGENLVSV